ncbi:MAG: GSCFA domain-containing protein [Muribaculaceae bacterium]|nr:GSCFA domain-containing protein [Muribaculaceae bacterium]
MEFRTTVTIDENRGLLAHGDKVLLLGSCFSDNIGGRMRQAMMRVMINPMGTLYNPMSVAASLDRIIDNAPVEGRDLVEHGGVWNHFDFHSRHSLPDKAATIERMNRRVAEAHAWLADCRLLVVTLGSAMAYRHRESGRVVANCHKLPPQTFHRQMVTVTEAEAELKRMVERVVAFNPAIKILFTVSPIRHIADTLAVNSLSKATLLVAEHAVVKSSNRHLQKEGEHSCLYFPSYEIMMDDLRDYRFYAADMVHPSDVAIEYLWQTFQSAYMDDRAVQAVARCERVARRLGHRPMSNSREAVERFRADTLTVVRNLVAEYPYVSEVPQIREMLDV